MLIDQLVLRRLTLTHHRAGNYRFPRRKQSKFLTCRHWFSCSVIRAVSKYMNDPVSSRVKQDV